MKRLQLNRLWVQFSVAFAAVILLGAAVLILTGFLLRPPRPDRPERERPDPPPELRAQIREYVATTLIVLAVTGGVVGILGGVWTARRLTAPLDELARGVEAIGAQDVSYRVAEKGSYETVTLARSFNQMTAQLEEAEQLRQNLLADVAHELRTPLTVLQGNLRALLDDVYALDKSEVARLYDQTRHLSGLVNDLHELAQAEARRLPLAAERGSDRAGARVAPRNSMFPSRLIGRFGWRSTPDTWRSPWPTAPAPCRSCRTCWPTRCATPVPRRRHRRHGRRQAGMVDLSVRDTGDGTIRPSCPTFSTVSIAPQRAHT
ncbi:MAG: histidine kinase dimerization/phospho-acceptor domain-containing protein [Caldilineaceae bacterium]